MKKLLMLFGILFLLSGCSVTYELTITEDSVRENVTIYGEDSSDNEIISIYEKPVEAFIDSAMSSESIEKLPGEEYYEMTKNIDALGNRYLNLNYNFKKEDFKRASIINYSVSSFEIEEEKDELRFFTGSYIKAFEQYNGINTLDIKVNVDPSYEIVSSNAHSISGNVLSWQIKKENKRNSPLNLTIRKKKEGNDNETPSNPSSNNSSNTTNNANDNSGNNLILAFGALILFALVLVIIITVRNKYNK